MYDIASHPYAEVFPLLAEDELSELARDITENGQREPIRLFDGLVLDGRNRLKACKLAGVKPLVETFTGNDDEALALVVSLNLHRRHLTAGQRALAGARVLSIYEEEAKKRQGTRTDLNIVVNLPQSEPVKSRARAAAVVGVSPSNIQHAKALLQSAEPSVVRAVESGTLTIHAATKAAKLDPEQQREVVKRVREGKAKNPHQAMREVRQEARIAEVAAVIDESPRWRLDTGDAVDWFEGAPSAACVVMDPPYGLDTHRTRAGGKDYADGEDYALALLRAVIGRIADTAQPGAHVYCFTGYSHVEAFKRILRERLEVQDNPIVWVKDNHTMCSFEDWYPNKYELILFAKVPGARRTLARCMPDVLTFARSRETTHSAEKPIPLLRALIEQSTVPGELVIDPFAGSGSTGVAALAAGRTFAGCEIDPKNADIARSRLVRA